MAPLIPDAIHQLYDALPDRTEEGSGPRLRPFIGTAFHQGEPEAFRVMGIGVNADCLEGERLPPDTWASGFVEQKWKFQRGVTRDLAALAQGLEGSAIRGGRAYHRQESVYLTNAVKRWLPGARHAGDVDASWLEEGRKVFQEELAVLSEASRLPHMVVVFGRRQWDYVWPCFQKGASSWSEDYEPMAPDDDLFHHLNVVRVREHGSVRPLLLLGLRHPSHAHWGNGWSTTRILAHPTFQRVAGLGDQHPERQPEAEQPLCRPPSVLGDRDVEDVFRGVVQRLTRDLDRGLKNLLTEDRVRWHLVEELLERGVPASRIHSEYGVAEVGLVDLVLDDPPGAVIELKFPRDPREKNAPDTMTCGKLLRDFARLAACPVEQRYALQVIPARLRQHLDRRSDLTWALMPGERLHLTSALLDDLRKTTRDAIGKVDIGEGVEVTCVFSGEAGDLAVLGYAVQRGG